MERAMEKAMAKAMEKATKKVKNTNGGGVALTVFLILLVLALGGGLTYVIFGMDVVPGVGDNLSIIRQETAQEEDGETGADGETGETAGPGNGSFVPIVLPEGAGTDASVPFAQAAPADGADAASGDASPSEGAGPDNAGTGGAETDGGNPETAEPAADAAAPSAEPAAPPPAVDYATANKRPKGLTMSTEDFTVTKIGQKTQLSASGGAGVYNWISQNPAVATVDASGLVTAVSGGTTNVLATDGVVKGVCVVRVKALSEEYSLNKSDFTRSVAEGPYQLKLNGFDGSVLWTSSNTAVATVGPDGTVTPVAAGFAVITASWGEHSRQCFVHVTG